MGEGVVGFGEGGIDVVVGDVGVVEVYVVGGVGGYVGGDFYVGEVGVYGVGDGGDYVWV